ncbi:UNVERIFIED_CONTAM: hypothetical protein PYX00_011468 [Menopon gallinae]|uniref:Phosphatidylinositol N-acetylglucosaminyltransferase n=1 Tax=Menopon gallinae TaxID=328185 RepID=A0AAW2H7N3_9NEOP
MVSDYFYPGKGGVETHIMELSKHLIKLGHKVIGITHKYPNCPAVASVGKFKIYYLNIPVFHMNTAFPTTFSHFFLLVDVLVREEIHIVHGHHSMSTLCYDALLCAQTLNLKSVFTDHSLFETGAVENIIVNRVLRFVLQAVDRAICVSYTLKENLMERTGVDSDIIHVVPNAVSRSFGVSKKSRSGKTIVVSSCRFTYRKGIDILIQVIPKVCAIVEDLEFVILGDGPKRDELEQMIDDHSLKDRITLLGSVDHKDVGKVLGRCDVFLNTSLTESFCMAIIEAAACGLHVVSTNVGAVHEVLPPHIITLVRPDVDEVVEGVVTAVSRLNRKNRRAISRETKKIYDWRRVAADTEAVYGCIRDKEVRTLARRLSDRLLLEPGALSIYFRLAIVISYIFLLIYKFTHKK